MVNTKVHVHHPHHDMTIRFDEKPDKEKEMTEQNKSITPKEAYNEYLSIKNFYRVAQKYDMEPQEMRALISKGKELVTGSPLREYIARSKGSNVGERHRNNPDNKKKSPKHLNVLFRINKSAAKQYIAEALRINRYDISATANWLSVSASSVSRMARKLNIEIKTPNKRSGGLRSEIAFLKARLAKLERNQ